MAVTHSSSSSIMVIVPRIPQELQDEVIKHIDSKKGLIVASHVSRAWFARSRKYLFRKVNVSPSMIPDLEHFLREKPHIAAYVQKLQIRGASGDDEESGDEESGDGGSGDGESGDGESGDEESGDGESGDLESDDGEDDDGENNGDENNGWEFEDREGDDWANVDGCELFDTAQLVHLLQLLPNIRKLHLINLSYTECPQPFPPFEVHLDRLRLEHILTWSDPVIEGNFMATLSLFRSVRECHIMELSDTFTSLEDEANSDQIIQQRIHPDAFAQVSEFSISCTPSYPKWLDLLRLSCATSQSLVSLSIWVQDGSSGLTSIGALLHAAGRNLSCLTLEFSDNSFFLDQPARMIQPSDIEAALAASLATCTQLRTCVFAVRLMEGGEECNEVAWGCLSAAMGILPASVDTLTLWFRGVPYALVALIQQDTHRVAQALQTWKGPSPEQKTLRIEFIPGYPDEDWQMKESCLHAAFNTLGVSFEATSRLLNVDS